MSWRNVDGHHLEKEFRFPDFATALAVTNRIGAIAEELNHHPNIHLSWGRVRVQTWSHDVCRLAVADSQTVDGCGSHKPPTVNRQPTTD